MGTRKERSDNWIRGGFVAITYGMMDSKAFKQLSGKSVKVLIYFLRKVKTHDSHDRYNKKFPFTYSEAKGSGIGHNSFSRSLKQLQEYGFIDCVRKGGMRCDEKQSSLYRLSKRWEKYGKPDFAHLHNGYSEEAHG